MFRKLLNLFSFLNRRSLDTKIWCLCVIGGAVLMVMSFFVSPAEREIVIAEDGGTSDVIAVIEYSSVLGSISELDSVDKDCVAEVTSVIPSTTYCPVTLDDVPSDEIAQEDDFLLMPSMIADAVAASFAGMAVVNNPVGGPGVCLDVKYTVDEIELLERLVECEAMSEDEEGKLLVANVVLNRLRMGKWGDTLEEVIEAPGQFDPVTRGSVETVTVSPETINACMRAINGEDISKGAIFFRKSKSTDDWGDKKYLFSHGSHAFYIK